MLSKRFRAINSKQGLMMSDPQSLPSSKHSRPTAASFFFASPTRILFDFSSNGYSDCEVAMSPTSILETKPFSANANPFFYDRNPRMAIQESTPAPTIAESSRHWPWHNGGSKAIGLGIVDALGNDKHDDESSKLDSRMVLFGSQLKIQIPSMHPNSILPNGSVESPHSPIEFGVKNKNSQLALLSPAWRSPMGSANVSSRAPPASPGVFTGYLSTGEVEMSEDYTCVIAHGPNPKTTHIFENCIVKSFGDRPAPLWKHNRLSDDCSSYPCNDFLTFCHTCKKKLGQGKDTFMYRGEKAFCSNECRYQEMLFDEGMEISSGNPSGTL